MPTKTQEKNIWDYFQVCGRKCSRRNLIRAIWSEVKVPVNSHLLKQHRYMNCGHKSVPTRAKRGRPYHKTIAIVFASRLLQIGKDQWPHTDDVGDNIHKMRHSQVIGQDDLLQSGNRGHPIARLSALQPIDDEFVHGVPVQTAELTGSSPL